MLVDNPDCLPAPMDLARTKASKYRLSVGLFASFARTQLCPHPLPPAIAKQSKWSLDEGAGFSLYAR